MGLSCIIPARNEEGNIAKILSEILSIGIISDIIIVEGGSTDNTYILSLDLAQNYPSRVRLVKQLGSGKFDAVYRGAQFAREKFLIIWDADGTVPLCCTTRLIERHQLNGNPIIGNRLAGKMEKGAMQYFNFIGNWLFALAWAPILRSKPVDMLCGTKIVHTEIFSSVPFWLKKIDTWGDFALIATTRAQGHTVDSIWVDYNKRKSGYSNMKRWSSGIRLLFETVGVYLWLAFAWMINE